MAQKKKPIRPSVESTLPRERPSARMLRTWAKRITRGNAVTIPVFTGGAWTLQVLRGHKRVLQVPVEQNG